MCGLIFAIMQSIDNIPLGEETNGLNAFRGFFFILNMSIFVHLCFPMVLLVASGVPVV